MSAFARMTFTGLMSAGAAVKGSSAHEGPQDTLLVPWSAAGLHSHRARGLARPGAAARRAWIARPVFPARSGAGDSGEVPRLGRRIPDRAPPRRLARILSADAVEALGFHQNGHGQ